MLYYFNTCTFCIMTKCTIISHIIALTHVSTISCHPQGACNQYLAKLHKYFIHTGQHDRIINIQTVYTATTQTDFMRTVHNKMILIHFIVNRTILMF